MNNNTYSRDGLIKNLIIAGVLLFIAAGLLIGLHFWEKSQSIFPEQEDYEGYGVIKHDGRIYEERLGITTVLLMGLDSMGEASSEPLYSYNNDNQADFLMLLVIDKANKLCSAIQINRDTMADVNVLAIGGKQVGTVNEQIALAYTYGSGAKDSCRNTVKAVSSLLFGIDIDHYVAVTMNSVAKINDLVGGVAVTVNDDFTGIDDTLKKGETVTLLGEHALTYVRTRAGLEDSTNLARMERQHQYMKALYTKIVEHLDAEDSFTEDAVADLAEYTITDISVDYIDDLVNMITDYENGEIHTLKGTPTVNNGYMEFRIDTDSAKELLIRLAYEEIK